MEVLLYFVAISVISMAVTIYDKIAAKYISRHRISEKALLILAISGGALTMYITMIFIRHKTLHKRFMIGLPCIIILQLILVFVILTCKPDIFGFTRIFNYMQKNMFLLPYHTCRVSISNFLYGQFC